MNENVTLFDLLCSVLGNDFIKTSIFKHLSLVHGGSRFKYACRHNNGSLESVWLQFLKTVFVLKNKNMENMFG